MVKLDAGELSENMKLRRELLIYGNLPYPSRY